VALVILGEDELLPPAPPAEYERAAEYGLVCPASASEEEVGPLLLNGDVESKVTAEEADEAGVYGIVVPCWETWV